MTGRIEVDLTVVGKHFAYALERHPELKWFERNKGIEEPDLMHFFARHIQPGDQVIDAGACVGVFTLMLSRLVGDTGTVLAFEPDPVNYERLCQNLKLNAMQNVVASPFGLWSTNCWLKFSSLRNGYSSVLRMTDPDTNVITVPALTLDQVLTKEDHPRLLKLDCEGSEVEILKGAQAALRRGIDYVIVEFHFPILDIIQVTEKQIREDMAALGYDAFVLLPDGETPMFIPPDKTLNVRMSLVELPPRCNVLFQWKGGRC